MKTKLTEKFELKHPIIQAPMAFAAGGKLASAVTAAGGLGLIGGGYGDEDWVHEQFDATGNQSVGCGFITWSIKQKPHLLDMVLDRNPAAVFLSFDDPEPLNETIKAAGVPFICQVQTLRDAKHAIDLGADVIVAQGSEAGGHGEKRATFTFVPEVADYIASSASDVVLCAAGGIADGRGLAASLALGADGVLVGSRFWATSEALVHPDMLNAAIKADGDDTIRSKVVDVARGYPWPDRYNARVLHNEFTDQWHDDLDGLKESPKAAQQWVEGWAAGDPNAANVFIGEATGLIHGVKPAADIINEIVEQAEQVLAKRYQ
ncbi:nitronate monooxygenase [Amylibacter sp. SFDW26]|nr:nitronate monooxygenase [Amylibacter sp. SFDW26]KAB7616408.1 nitronate monooxygenase [Amylibacter sp. SFDW26]